MNVFLLRLLIGFLLSAGVNVASFPISLPPTEPIGMAFHKGSWKDVLAEAKRQNKPIFLDIYTNWCPPCRRMAKEAFPDPKLGTKFNTHFINYQLNAELGEGLAIAKQYAVASYPTGLYLSPSGALIHRAVGYGGVNAMIALADHVLALPQMKPTVAKGDRDFASGRRDLAFLKKYLKTRQELNRPFADVLDSYVSALPESELFRAETIAFVAEHIQSSGTKAFDFLTKSRFHLPISDLLTMVSDAQHQALGNDFSRAISTNDEKLLEQIIANHEQLLTAMDASRSEAQKQETAHQFRQAFQRKEHTLPESGQ